MLQVTYLDSLFIFDLDHILLIGDQNLKDPLYAMGGIGVFTKIVEVEL